MSRIFSRLVYAIEEYDKENPLDLPTAIKSLLSELKEAKSLLVSSAEKEKIDDEFWKTRGRAFLVLLEEAGGNFSDILIHDNVAHDRREWFFLGGSCVDRMTAEKFLRTKIEGPKKIQIDEGRFYETLTYMQKSFAARGVEKDFSKGPKGRQFSNIDQFLSILMHEGLNDEVGFAPRSERKR